MPDEAPPDALLPPKKPPPPKKVIVTFFDSTIAIGAYNAIATVSTGPMHFDKIRLWLLAYFFGKVTIEAEQLLDALRELEKRGLVRQVERGLWDVVDAQRRILLRRKRPDPNDPKSGWEEWGLQSVTMLPGAASPLPGPKPEDESGGSV